VEALGEGERSEKVRIRGPEELFRVLEELSPKDRGLALIRGLEVLGRWPKEGGWGCLNLSPPPPLPTQDYP
jgi:hypothetical protein